MLLRSYYLYIESDKVRLAASKPRGIVNCKTVFEKLGEVLRKEGFKLVYVSKRDHEEEAYRNDDAIVILLHKQCVIRTNLPLEKLEDLIRKTMFMCDASGIM